jgi:peptidoglycan/LPS O-acetylase OafA/YrhL
MQIPGSTHNSGLTRNISNSGLTRNIPAEGVRAEVGNVAGMDGLRGVAMGAVLLFHWLVLREDRHADALVGLAQSSPLLEFVFRCGYLGVDLFFLITGFLLVLPWLKHADEGRPAPATREFYRRRALRIVPAFYVQLAFLFFVAVPLVLGLDYWRRDLYVLAGNLIAHLGFLHYLTPLTSASLNLNGALWTLTLEVQYYLVLPLLAPLFVRRPWATAGAMVAVALLWHERAAHGMQVLVDAYLWLGRMWSLTEAAGRHFLVTQIPGYLAHFAAGLLAGRAWWRLRDTPGSPRNTLLASVVLIAAPAALALVLVTGSRALGEFTWLLTPLLLGLAVWAAVARRLGWAVRVLDLAPIAFLGRVSYSLYLYHLPMLLLFNLYLPDAPPLLAFPLYLAATLSLAWVSYRFVEVPFMNLRERKPRHG